MTTSHPHSENGALQTGPPVLRVFRSDRVISTITIAGSLWLVANTVIRQQTFTGWFRRLRADPANTN